MEPKLIITKTKTCNNITYINNNTFYHLTFCLQILVKPEIVDKFNNFRTKTLSKCESISTCSSISPKSKNKSPPITKATAHPALTSFETSTTKSAGMSISSSQDPTSMNCSCYNKTPLQTPMEHKYKISCNYSSKTNRYKKCCKISTLMS